MKVEKKQLDDYIEEATNIPGSLSVPIDELDSEDIEYLATVAKNRDVEVRAHYETSNFHCGVLVCLQRYKNRYKDPALPQITYKE
jgi:hypothetical protein